MWEVANCVDGKTPSQKALLYDSSGWEDLSLSLLLFFVQSHPQLHWPIPNLRPFSLVDGPPLFLSHIALRRCPLLCVCNYPILSTLSNATAVSLRANPSACRKVMQMRVSLALLVCFCLWSFSSARLYSVAELAHNGKERGPACTNTLPLANSLSARSQTHSCFWTLLFCFGCCPFSLYLNCSMTQFYITPRSPFYVTENQVAQTCVGNSITGFCYLLWFVVCVARTLFLFVSIIPLSISLILPSLLIFCGHAVRPGASHSLTHLFPFLFFPRLIVKDGMPIIIRDRKRKIFFTQNLW